VTRAPGIWGKEKVVRTTRVRVYEVEVSADVSGERVWKRIVVGYPRQASEGEKIDDAKALFLARYPGARNIEVGSRTCIAGSDDATDYRF